MSTYGAAPITRDRCWHWRTLAVLLILGTAGLRLLYLASASALDLAPDEAHYWHWSQHLDWSYYSKGPLVAYLIRLGCDLAGTWSEHLIGNDMLAVRLPAVLCGALLLGSIYVLTVQVYASDRLALLVVGLALTMPVVSAASEIMTIDGPYTCCWGWAAVFVHRAIFRRSAWAWPAAGLVLGLGILAKYTMILWVPSVGLFLLSRREYRPLLRCRGFWLMTGVGALCCLPILIWNVQNGWVGLWHVNRLAGLQTGRSWHWEGPFTFLIGQCGVWLVFWFLAWLSAMVSYRPWRGTSPQSAYLWWLSAPTFVVFLLFSFKTGGGEVNWPAAAYVTGLILAGAWLVQQVRNPPSWHRRLTIAGLAAVCGVGVLASVYVHRSTWFYPLLGALDRPDVSRDPFPFRRFDPSSRLRGWRTLAGEVDGLRRTLRAAGHDPVVVGTSWALPGELAFYCEGHPACYSVGLMVGDRHSQYDHWHPNPVADSTPFAGKTFIIVGGFSPAEFQRAFDVLEPPRLVVHSEAGYPVSAWYVTVARGFHGFPPPRPGGRIW